MEDRMGYQMPKGLPDRKTAVCEKRRKLAASTATTKGQEREDDRHMALEDPAGVGEGERRRRFAAAVWWAYQMGPSVPPPDELRRMLQRAKKQKETWFLKQVVLAVLPTPPKEAPLPRTEPVRTGAVLSEAELAAGREKLRKFLEENPMPMHGGKRYGPNGLENDAKGLSGTQGGSP